MTNAGKSVRDLCLQVQDINRPTRRMIRSGNAEAYLEIEGTHPKQFQIGEIRSNHSLQAHDIQVLSSFLCKYAISYHPWCLVLFYFFQEKRSFYQIIPQGYMPQGRIQKFEECSRYHQKGERQS